MEAAFLIAIGTVLGAVIAAAASARVARKEVGWRREERRAAWRREHDREAASAATDAYLLVLAAVPDVVAGTSPDGVKEYVRDLHAQVELVRHRLALTGTIHPDPQVSSLADEAMKPVTQAANTGRRLMNEAAAAGTVEAIAADRWDPVENEAMMAVLRLRAAIKGENPHSVVYPRPE